VIDTGIASQMRLRPIFNAFSQADSFTTRNTAARLRVSHLPRTGHLVGGQIGVDSVVGARSGVLVQYDWRGGRGVADLHALARG